MRSQSRHSFGIAALLLAVALQLLPLSQVGAESAPAEYLPAPSELPVLFRGSWSRVEHLEDETIAVARYVHQGPRSPGRRPGTLVMLAAVVKDPARTETLYYDWIATWETQHGTTFAPLDSALGDAAVTARWIETQDEVAFERIRVFFRCSDVLGYADVVGVPGTLDLDDALDVASLIGDRILSTPRVGGWDPDEGD